MCGGSQWRHCGRRESENRIFYVLACLKRGPCIAAWPLPVSNKPPAPAPASAPASFTVLALGSVNPIRAFLEPQAAYFSTLGLPDWLVHWGHPGNMFVVLAAMVRGWGTGRRPCPLPNLHPFSRLEAE